MAAVGGCCSRGRVSACEDGPPPRVASFIVAVGGCCGRPDSAAADDAAVLGSAAPMAALGGCCPMAVEAAPDVVGPEPASREASSFVTFSISAVHCPASAAPISMGTRTQAPNVNAIVFMALFSRLKLRKVVRSANSDVSISTDETNRRSGGPTAGDRLDGKSVATFKVAIRPRWRLTARGLSVPSTQPWGVRSGAVRR
jgi:hypothetical protein